MRGGQRQALLLVEGLRARGHESPFLTRPGLSAIRGAIECADIVHAHDARSHTLAAVAGARGLVVSRRVVFPLRQSIASRWKYRRAALYLAVSRHVRECMIRDGVSAARIRVVYDGVPLRESSRRGRTLVAPATEDPRKGSDLVRRAAAIAGIEVVFSNDLDRDLEGAAMLLYVTRAEGLGSAALLAMSAGVPVVASAVGGLPEVVEHERTGLLVNNDPEDIAAAVQRLLDDDSLAARLGACARERVRAEFSADRMVEATLAAYEEVLA